METAVESVQSDVRLLTDQRDRIRRTFNDLTLKLIHSQVYTLAKPGECGKVPSLRTRLASKVTRRMCTKLV